MIRQNSQHTQPPRHSHSLGLTVNYAVILKQGDKLYANQNRQLRRSEVPTGVATLHELARYGSDRAADDFSAFLQDYKDLIRIIYKFYNSLSLIIGL